MLRPGPKVGNSRRLIHNSRKLARAGPVNLMRSVPWIEWAKALGVPILAVAVSFATYRSGHWQVRIAREKLRHDLYDRRYAIYLAFRRLLAAIVEKDDIDGELRQANAARSQCPFLLDRRLGSFLDKLYKEAYRLNAENTLIHEQNVWSRERTARAAQLGSDKLSLASRVGELIREFECLRLTDLSD
jgi:hypothetical protein